MRIGLISDIHGNIQALDTVLEELARLKVDRTLCIGDLVCYGANPSEVLQRLRERCIPAVMGNYDEAVALNLPTASRKPSSPQNEPLKRAALEWTQQVATNADREYLRNLPRTSSFDFAGERVHMVHAGMQYLDEWVAPDSPDSMQRMAAYFPGDIVVLGHTHQQFKQLVDGTLLINPGAVGRSLDGDPSAAFAILDVSNREVHFYRLNYPLVDAVSAIEATDMPTQIAQLIKHAARRIEDIGA